MIPILAPLLRNPIAVWVVGAVCAGLVALSMLGISLWHCPTLQMFDIECPGCGMTRATGALLGGRFEESWALHPFAGLFVLFATAAGLGSLLREEKRERLAQRVEVIERKTGIVMLPFVAFLLYGLARIAWQL